jgi:hypothetical protein
LESLVHHLRGLETQLTKRFSRPPVLFSVRSPGARRLRDQQPCPDPQQGSGALGQHGGPPERSRQHSVEFPTESSVSATDFGPFFQHRDAGLEIEALGGLSQKGGPPPVCLNQDQIGPWPFPRHNEAREATARTQVGKADRRRRGQTSTDGSKSLRMSNLRLQRARAEETKGAGFRQEFVQERGGVAPLFGAGHRRLVSPPAR